MILIIVFLLNDSYKCNVKITRGDWNENSEL